MAKRKKKERREKTASPEQAHRAARRTHPKRPKAAKPAGSAGWDLAIALLWTTLWLVPLVHAKDLGDSFRLPKMLVTETLAIASLAALAWRLRSQEWVDSWGWLRQPAVRALAPMLLVATAGWLWTAHPVVVRGPLASLWLTFACIVGWQLGLRLNEFRSLLRGLIVPASLLSVIAVLDYHGLASPFVLQGDVDQRFAVTSLAGGPFDLGAYLVLPILIAQAVLWQRPRDHRWWLWLGALVLSLYTVALTQTFTALAATVVGSLVLWLRLLPKSRFKALLAVCTGAMVAMGILVMAVAPLRERVAVKVENVRNGDWDRLLTGRLDAWKTAWWMLRENPWTGVGHGAFRVEFAPAKLALRDEKVRFYRFQHNTHFDNAHNEFIEAAASWGWPGVASLGWGIWVFAATGRRVGNAQRSDESPPGRVGREDRAVALAGLTALIVMAVTYFPMHIRLVSFPYLILIAAVFAADRDVSRSEPVP